MLATFKLPKIDLLQLPAQAADATNDPSNSSADFVKRAHMVARSLICFSRSTVTLVDYGAGALALLIFVGRPNESKQ